MAHVCNGSSCRLQPPMRDPMRKQADAMAELEGIAKGLRETYPAKTDAQCFELVF
jgi:hypothetical protein